MTAGASRGGSVAPPPPAEDPAPAGEDGHAWLLGGWWDLYFTLVTAAMALMALLTGEPAWRLPLAGLMAALAAAYWGFARPMLLRREHGRPLALMALLLVLCLPAMTLNSALTFVTVGVVPLCFMSARIPAALSTVAALLLAPPLLRGLYGLSPWDSVALNLLVNCVMVGFTLWFGKWLERIIGQSYERAELVRELRESRGEVVRLSEEAGAMAERERLAREVHDTLAQGLTSIVTLTQAVESEMGTAPDLARRHLVMMRETAAENLAEARAMVAARQPVGLEEGTLEAALERITSRLGEELGIEAHASVRGAPAALPNDLQVCVLRTAQEALANVRRHSRAAHVRVDLEYPSAPDHERAQAVELTVADDGVGFPPERNGTGNGLRNMRQRAHGVGGLLEVTSARGRGTTIRMSLPLAASDPHDDGEKEA